LFGASRFWGPQTGANPTDRAKRGSKRHLICDGRGIPLAIELTGANCHDSTQALPLLDAIPPLQGPRGRPRCHPDCILGDRAYDAERIRRALRARHISPLLAMRNTENGSGLGLWRWVIERTFAWLNQFRRLRLRYEKKAEMHKAFLSLACALICWKFLQGHFPWSAPSRATGRKWENWGTFLFMVDYFRFARHSGTIATLLAGGDTNWLDKKHK
jgi:transposase